MHVVAPPARLRGLTLQSFRNVAEAELLGLHEGNFARYTVRPGEFAAWHEVWGA